MSIIERLRAWAHDDRLGDGQLLLDAAERLEWFESAGGVTMATRIHAVMIENERLTADRDALQRDWDAERDGRLVLRQRFGARDGETWAMFLARLTADRDAALALLRAARKAVVAETECPIPGPEQEAWCLLLAEIDALLATPAACDPDPTGDADDNRFPARARRASRDASPHPPARTCPSTGT